MAFTQIPFEYFSDAGVNTVSRSARFLDLEGKGWCNEHRTDGALPKAMLHRITDAADPEADAAELVTAQLWTVTDTGWQVNWSHQMTAAQAKDKADANNKRQKNYQDRTRRHAAGDHSICIPRYCEKVRTNGVSNGISNALPVQSSPAQPARAGAGLGNTHSPRANAQANATGKKSQPTAKRPKRRPTPAPVANPPVKPETYVVTVDPQGRTYIDRNGELIYGHVQGDSFIVPLPADSPMSGNTTYRIDPLCLTSIENGDRS